MQFYLTVPSATPKRAHGVEGDVQCIADGPAKPASIGLAAVLLITGSPHQVRIVNSRRVSRRLTRSHEGRPSKKLPSLKNHEAPSEVR